LSKSDCDGTHAPTGAWVTRSPHGRGGRTGVGRASWGCLRSGGDAGRGGGHAVVLGVEGGEVGLGGRDGVGEGSCEGAVTVDLDRDENIK
jgi:hypothetical protein